MHRQSDSADSLFTVATSKSKTKTRVMIPNYIYFKSETDFKLFHLERDLQHWPVSDLWCLVPQLVHLDWVFFNIESPSCKALIEFRPPTITMYCTSFRLLELLVRWWYRWLGCELLESGFTLRRTFIKILPKGQLHWSQLGSFPIWGPDSQLSGHAGDC